MYIFAQNPRYSLDKVASCRLGVIEAGCFSTEDYDIALQKPNGIPHYLLIFIKKGLAYIRRGEKEIWAEKNTLLLYHPKEAQELVFLKDESTEASWIVFSGSRASEILAELNLDGTTAGRLSGDTVTPIVRQLMQELPEANIYQDELLNSLLLQALARTAQNRALKEPAAGVESAIKKIGLEYNKNTPASVYAKECGISLSHFMRLFKQITGTSPHDFRLKLRIDAAKALLKTTDCTLAVIANQVGFKDPFHFSSYFKKITGLSPQKFRESKE